MVLKKSKRHDYTFALLCLQPRLSEEEVERFAVIVQSPSAILVLGQYPEESWDKVSDVGQWVLNEVSDVLREHIAKAVEEKVNVFDYLAGLYQWNIHIAPPERLTTEEVIMPFAHRLFNERVLQATTQAPDVSQEIPISMSGFFFHFPFAAAAQEAEVTTEPVV